MERALKQQNVANMLRPVKTLIYSQKINMFT